MILDLNNYLRIKELVGPILSILTFFRLKQTLYIGTKIVGIFFPMICLKSYWYFVAERRQPIMTLGFYKSTLIISVILSLMLPELTNATITPVFPGAEGYGSETRAMYADNRNPQICIVTDLTDDNGRLGTASRNGTTVKTGSFKECFLWKQPNKLIVFEVSGTISASKATQLSYPTDNFTIAGQTSPNPGITLKGYKLVFNGVNDGLVQHIRVRIGDDAAVPGGISCTYRDNINVGSTAPSTNIVIDHCSMSWAVDENAGLGYKGSKNITYSNNIMAEGLHNSCHNQGEHSRGMLIRGGGGPYSVIKNLFISNKNRNPEVYDSKLELINNLIINPGSFNVLLIGKTDWLQKITMEGNVVKSGQDTGSHAAQQIPEFYNQVAKTGSEYFIRNNWVNDAYGRGDSCQPTENDANDWQCVYKNPSSLNPEKYKVKSNPSIWSGNVNVLKMNEVENYIKMNVGARPADRDPVDSRLIAEVDNGEASLKNSVAEAGGFPKIAKNKITLVIPKNPHADADGDGYTNLEEWLHYKSTIVKGNGLEKKYYKNAAPKNLRIKNN